MKFIVSFMEVHGLPTHFHFMPNFLRIIWTRPILGKRKLGCRSWAVSMCWVSYQIEMLSSSLIMDTRRCPHHTQSGKTWKRVRRKLVLGKKWVGIKLRNQCGLEDWRPSYSAINIAFTTTIMDSPNTSSQSNIFEITCCVSSSISSTTLSSITPLKFSFTLEGPTE